MQNHIIGLVPHNQKLNDEIVSYSKELADVFGSPYVLGKKALPYIPLLMFEADQTMAEDMVIDLEDYVFGGMNLSFNTFYMQPGRQLTWAFYGIRVGLHQPLIDLQTRVHEQIGAPALKNNVGLAYSPRITLGCTEVKAHLPAFRLNSSLCQKQDVFCKLAFGKLGERGQLEEVLFKR